MPKLHGLGIKEQAVNRKKRLAKTGHGKKKKIETAQQ